MQDILKVEKNTDSIVRLILNDEKSGNSLSDEMISLMSSRLEEISNNEDIKVVVIASTGKIFCAGHNLKEMTEARQNNDEGKSYFTNLFQSCSDINFWLIQPLDSVVGQNRQIRSLMIIHLQEGTSN